MSRSYKHTPVHGITGARSEKWDKRKANRKLRHRVKEVLVLAPDVLPVLREVSNVWTMNKDGKFWFDPERWPKYLRK